MTQHVASQILAALESRLASVAPVYLLPVHAVALADLPGIFVEAVEDETDEQLGRGPLQERHTLSFSLFGCVAATTGFQAVAGTLRTDIEKALLATLNDIRLGGLCRPGLSRPSAAFRVETDTLEKPVGGWVLKFTCVYQLKTDAPDTAI